jgi:thioredoxin 1
MKAINRVKLVLVSFLFVAVGTSCNANIPEGDVVIIEDSKTFFELIKGDTPVLVDFYADWCRPCRVQGPIVDEIGKELKQKIIVVKVNVDNFPEISSQYEVRGIPSLILFDSGKLIWKKVGLQEKEMLSAAINKHP